MNKEKNDAKITFSQETQLSLRKRRSAFPVDTVDWERLRRMISNFPRTSGIWWSITSAAFSSSLSILLTYLTIVSEKNPYKTHLLIGIFVTATIGIMSLIFARVQKKTEGFAKSQILEEMQTIEITPIEEVEKLSQSFSSWVATHQEAPAPQGIDYREIPLNGASLRSLTFKISSVSPFWRAGFKLSVPNIQSMPTLLTPQSFLFHVGVTNNNLVGLWIYHDGKAEPAVIKELHQLASTQSITITVERDDNNYVRCYVNDSLEYNLRFNPELFKKVYLAAWGDGNQYDVSFDDIVYGLT